MRKTFVLLWMSALVSVSSLAQRSIDEAFEDYAENPRELVHVQMNKTHFYVGEMIGFKAYVMDKASKQLSSATRNLYCVISDLDNNAIKSSMLLVKDGVADSAIEIDTSFVPGKYLFKAYTNWMRNFDEPNYFSAVIQVSEFNTVIDNGNKTTALEPDIQVLPEGGHLLAEVPNSLGIIAKNQFGKGLSNAKAIITDNNNRVLSSVELDQFGIGKALLIPEPNTRYNVVVAYEGNSYESAVPEAKLIGLNMRLLEDREQLYVSIATNEQSYAMVKDQEFTLAIHNGDEIVLQSFRFEQEKEVNLLLKDKSLFKGMNILTVFDANNRPLLERLYFNHKGIEKAFTADISVKKDQDSLQIAVPIRNYANSGFTSLSVSVLPEGTKAYKPEGDILSNLFLRPYIKGHIENAAYYFDNPGARKQYQLNNLLLTQGWSSYNWNAIFSTQGIPIHKFEQGINFKVKINKKKANSYLIEGVAESNTLIFDLPEDENSFEGSGLYPSSGEKFAMTAIGTDGSVSKPGAYTNFFPSKIPKLDISLKTQKLIGQDIKKIYKEPGMLPLFNNEVTVLDEITIKAKKRKEREKMLSRQFAGFGDLRLVQDYEYDANLTLAQYLIQFGYETRENVASRVPFQIFQRRTRLTPLIIFDGVPLRNENYAFLYQFNINNVDYVIVDRYANSVPFGGQFGGVIRIKTKAGYLMANNRQFDGMFIQDFPLSFTTNKQFYVPNYVDYDSSFFREYGVLAWEGDLKPGSDGFIELSLSDAYKGPMNLYIEGIVDGRKFISEIKTVSQE